MKNEIIREALKNLAGAPSLARAATRGAFTDERDRAEVDRLFDALARYHVKPTADAAAYTDENEKKGGKTL